MEMYHVANRENKTAAFKDSGEDEFVSPSEALRRSAEMSGGEPADSAVGEELQAIHRTSQPNRELLTAGILDDVYESSSVYGSNGLSLPDDVGDVLRLGMNIAHNNALLLGGWPPADKIDPVRIAKAIIDASRFESDILPEPTSPIKENSVTGEGLLPPLSTAPKDTFRTVWEDGDPEQFLYKTYGQWLKGGRKCLTRSKLRELDDKLMKALQQRSTRHPERLSTPLAEIFASKGEAKRNEELFCEPEPLQA